MGRKGCRKRGERKGKERISEVGEGEGKSRKRAGRVRKVGVGKGGVTGDGGLSGEE